MSIATESRMSQWRQAIDEAELILGDVTPIQLSSYGRGESVVKLLLRYPDFSRLFSGKEVTKETNRHGVFFYYCVGAVCFEANTEFSFDPEKIETITLE